MIRRRDLALRWRIAVLSGFAIALLSVAASLISYWVVRSSLFENLEQGLRADVSAVVRAQSERGPAQAALQQGPTGGLYIQLYNPQGEFVTSSDDTFGPRRAIPADELLAALAGPGMWRGELGGRPVRAALMANETPPSIAVVLAPTDFISVALRRLAEAMAFTALFLTLLSVFIGYLVAAAAMRPITDLAAIAAKLDAEHLDPIDYQGPSDEVSQLANVLNELMGRLRASFDAQRSFLAETSHELRTPLTSLQGFLDRAVRRAGPEMQDELEDARRIAQSMSRLVVDLLQLSRGELVREYDPHLLDPYHDILRPVAEEFFGVQLRARSGSLLLGDPERLRQLIRNLTANAVRASGDPSKVRLELEAAGQQLILRVRDEGSGISPETLPRIFEKFYHGRGGGTGLGLAIAKQIVDLHDGEITVESELGKGSVFSVRLPAYLESDEGDEGVPAEVMAGS